MHLNAKEKYGFEVITFCADIGQEEDFEEIRKKALATGASKVDMEDLKEEFIRDFGGKRGSGLEFWHLKFLLLTFVYIYDYDLVKIDQNSRPDPII